MAESKYLDGTGLAQLWGAVKNYADAAGGGAAQEGLLGGGPLDTAAWLSRACPGTSGPARIESIHGKTVVWNQLVPTSRSTGTSNGITMTATNGVYTVTGTGTLDSSTARATLASIQVPANHKVYASIRRVGTGATNDDGISVADGFAHKFTPNFPTQDASTIFECTTGTVRFFTKPCLTTLTMDMTLTPQLIDLTLMFGAGNEPSTVAEFEALYPDAYYPYDAGSLLPVRMTGVESVGFNQWDEQWEVGGINNDTGQNTTSTTVCRSKNYIPVFPSTEYYYNERVALYFYDARKNYVGRRTYVNATTFTTGSNVHYLRFIYNAVTMPADICINLSGPRNGEYEPYWRYQRAIDAGVLRGAGTVYDELTADERITRVGERTYDGEGATWTFGTGNRFYTALSDAMAANSGNGRAVMDRLPLLAAGGTSTSADGFNIAEMNGSMRLFVSIEASHPEVTTVSAFNAWLAANPLTLHYALATPTTTPIDPPLNLTYRAASGGTERVMHDETTAPPTMVVQYGSTADGIRDRALEAIAAHDGPVAQTYHAVGSYLTLDGTLYKVTTAIAAGERITAGTNVTATTVMAEVIALTQ